MPARPSRASATEDAPHAEEETPEADGRTGAASAGGADAGDSDTPPVSHRRPGGRRETVFEDMNITLPELEQTTLREFSERLAVLEKLVQLGLARRLPAERAAAFELSPLLLRKPA